MPDYFHIWHQFLAPPFAPPTTNKIGAMVPAYFSMTLPD